LYQVKLPDMNAIFLLTTTMSDKTSSSADYIAGGLIALFILVYLLYALIKPENF